MGILADLVVAPADMGQALLASENPLTQWKGFSCNGMDSIKFATLLSLLSCNSPAEQYDRWTEAVKLLNESEESECWVFEFDEEATMLLSGIASQEKEDLNPLTKAWAATEEFEGWNLEDVAELVQATGDLAETAVLEKMRLYLWMSM